MDIPFIVQVAFIVAIAVVAIKLIIDNAINKVFARIDSREAARIAEEVRAENAQIQRPRRQEELDALKRLADDDAEILLERDDQGWYATISGVRSKLSYPDGAARLWIQADLLQRFPRARFDLAVEQPCEIGPCPVPIRCQFVLWRIAKSLICRVSSVVEQRFCKPQVVGSNPTPGTNKISVQPGHIGDRSYLRHG
jgi:hypothetical protein